MSKHLAAHTKKRIIISSIVIVVVLIGGGVYYFNEQHKQQVAEQKKALATEVSQLDEAAFRGDRDLAADYLLKIKKGDLDAAYSVYEKAANAAPDAAKKTTIYEQAVVAAYKVKQKAHTEKFAVKLTEVNDSYRASANAADIYSLNGDTGNQKKYLMQALDRLEELPKDSAEYTTSKQNYETLIADIEKK